MYFPNVKNRQLFLYNSLRKIPTDFLVWKFCGKAQFSHSFGRFARNYAETVPFRKISTPANQLTLRYFSQWLVMSDYLLSVASVQFIKANPKPVFEKLVFWNKCQRYCTKISMIWGSSLPASLTTFPLMRIPRKHLPVQSQQNKH